MIVPVLLSAETLTLICQVPEAVRSERGTSKPWQEEVEGSAKMGADCSMVRSPRDILRVQVPEVRY